MLPQTTKDGIVCKIDEIWEEHEAELSRAYDDMGQVKITLQISLESVDGGQTDCTVTIDSILEARPAKWTPTRIKDSKRIRLNNRQIVLPLVAPAAGSGVGCVVTK